MAHITYRCKPGRARQLVVNGLDLSNEIYRDVEVVEVGEGEFAEVGFRITLAVSRLDLDAETDVQVTDRLREVAQRVRSMSEDVD